MALLEQLKIGSNVSFTVFPSRYITTDFSDVKVLGILDLGSATAQNLDAQATFNLIFNLLPNPVQPKDDLFCKVELPSGQIEIVGLSWIDPDSVTLVNTTKMLIEIDGVNQFTDGVAILSSISAHGYRVSKVEYV